MAIATKESLDVVAVSTDKQSDAVTAATLDKLFYLSEGSNIEINEVREANDDEKTGYEEATEITAGVADGAGKLIQRKARPDFLAWGAALFTNSHAQSAVGTGYAHTSKLEAYPDNPAYFSLYHRKGLIVDSRRVLGAAINGMLLSFNQGEDLSAEYDVLTTGQNDNGQYTETVEALDNATSLTISFKVQGESVDNVYVMADLDDDAEDADDAGAFEAQCVVTNVNNTTKVLTITSLGGAGSATIKYRVIYTVDNTESGYTWQNIAALAALSEFTIKTSNVRMYLGGVATDTPSFSGGQIVEDELESLIYEASWQGRVIKSWRTGATIPNVGSAIQTGKMIQTITLSRRVRDFMLRNYFNLHPNAWFSIYIECLGPTFDGSNPFKFELYFPRVGILSKPMQVSNGRWVEQGNLRVLQELTNVYPTVIFKTTNEQDGYLA